MRVKVTLILNFFNLLFKNLKNYGEPLRKSVVCYQTFPEITSSGNSEDDWNRWEILKKVFLATSSHKFLRFRWTNRSQEFFLLFLEKLDFSPLHSWCISRRDDLQDFNFQWAGKFKNVYNRSFLIYRNWFESVIS